MIHTKDLERHRQTCRSKVEPPSCDQIEILDHAFIFNGCLHSFAAVRSEKGEELKAIGDAQCEEMVLLSAPAMTLLSLAIGDLVQIFSSNNECEIQTAWPLKDQRCTNISISISLSERLNINGGIPMVIKLSRFDGPRLPASHLVMEPIDGVQLEYFTDAGFISHFTRKNDGKFVQVGSQLAVQFCGQKSSLRVGHVSSAYSEGTEDQEVDFSRLSLSDGPRFFYITSSTKVTFGGNSGLNVSSAVKVEKGLRAIGGLTKEVDRIKDILEIAFRKTSDRGFKVPKGILLFGPSGSGKTLLCRALATESKRHCIFVNGPEMFSKFYGETEAKLRAVFQEAKDKEPAMIFFDDIDTICPKREKSSNQQEQRVTATILTMLDSLQDERVVVIAATNKPDWIDAAVRRPGRLDEEIEIGIPDPRARKQILDVLLLEVEHNLSDQEVSSIAQVTHGFVGADLTALVFQAGMRALKRLVDGPQLTFTDFQTAIKTVKPSAIREIIIDVPKVRWDDIGGEEDLKLKLKQSVEWPLKHPEAFKRMGITPPKGFLLYGPPGCSKTLIARALATESGLNFIAIKGPELFSKWVGESEKAVREVFRKARASAPSVVFFDEIDALAAERGRSSGGTDVGDRVLTQLLIEMDGLDQLKDVVIVAATNRPDMIDRALLRPGRLDRMIYVPLPDHETRAAIFQLQFKKMPIASDVRVEDLVQATKGYSGAEVVAVCHESALLALQEDIEASLVCGNHFEGALRAVKPRTSPSTIEFYENYNLTSRSS